MASRSMEPSLATRRRKTWTGIFSLSLLTQLVMSFHSARLMDSYNILWRKFPGLHEYLLDLSKDPIKRRAICSEVK
jgi:hypothetical protein